MNERAQNLADRLIRYAKIDTQSDPFSKTFPSTEKQKDLSKLLVQELQTIGIQDAEMDQYGYVFATIPSNSDKNNIPTICFCSHVDTAPDCSGTGVKPILHRNYQGEDIVLPDDNSQVISISQHPYLKERIGDDIITASGTTLLGADDKAGVAIIMELANFLSHSNAAKHGDIRILFTPDEEVGRGVDHLDMKKLNADFGYTLDGGNKGSLEGDTFSANALEILFKGITAHPGYAKGKMVNAMKVLSYFMTLLPSNEFCPEATEGNQGFVHPTNISGELGTAKAGFLIRDFTTAKLEEHQERIKEFAESAIRKFPGATYEIKITEQYRNMREILDLYPQVEGNAIEAIERCGIPVIRDWVRGGTDGSRLSFMGLPCPNIFTGEKAIHGKHEYVSVQDMDAALDVLIELAKVYEEKA